MGTYYSAAVLKDRKTVQLFGSTPQQKFTNIVVPSGYRLVGKFFNGLWEACPDVTSESEFVAFEDSYSKGNWIRRDYYIVPVEELGEPR